MQNRNTNATPAQILCAGLFSPNFEFYMDMVFEQCNRKNVQRITRAYDVFIDLRAGIDLNSIKKSRLESFNSILLDYILSFPEDARAHQIWEMVDSRLAICA